MCTNEFSELERFATPRRAHRAVTEAMTVIDPNDARDTDEAASFMLSSSSGSMYALTRFADGSMTCTCPDVQQNLDGERCKHQHRLAFAIGQEPIPAQAREEIDGVLQRRVDADDWGAHYEAPDAEAEQSVAADGGECQDCAELPGDFPCADCYVAGDAEVPDDPADA